MDYEKKYKEALERAKKFEEKYGGGYTGYIFPDLAESEDERIRKFICSIIDNLEPKDFVGVKKMNVIAWLEKQKQSTDAKLERVIKASRSVLNNWLDGTDCPDVSGAFAELEYAIREYDGEEKQKEQKPAWSEEETKDLVHILKVLDDCYAYGRHDLSKTDYDNLTSTIKSLRPSWKPSEEQKEYIRTIKSLIADFIRDKQPEDVDYYQNIYDWLDGKEDRK